MGRVTKNAANFSQRKKTAMYAKIDTWQSRIARLLFIAMCCIMPIYLGPDLYMRLPQDKWNFMMLSMALVMLFAIAIWVCRLTRSPILLPQSGMDIADWAIIGFGAITLIATFASPFRHYMNIWTGIAGTDGRFDGTLTQLAYIAIFFVISRWYRPREKDFMWFCIFSIAMSLVGIFQFFGMDFFGLWPTEGHAYAHLPFHEIFIRTTLGNTNTVSVFITLATLFCGFLFIRKPSKWQPLWLATSALTFWMGIVADADSGTVGIAAAMLLSTPFMIESSKTLGRTLILASLWLATYVLHNLLFGVVYMATRTAPSLLPFAALFALLLASGLVLTHKGKEPDPEGRPKWKLGIALMAAFIALGIAGVEVLGRPDAYGAGSGILYEAREILHGNIRDEFGTNRIYIWRHALTAFPNNPIIGTGPDTFGFAFPFEAQNYFGEFYENAHNEYVQYLITHGILGLLAYLLFAGSIIAKSVRKAFRDPIIMATLAAFVGHLAQAFFNISHPIASQILWVFAGILMSRRLRDEALQKDAGHLVAE
ncbi:MAG: O-antigen ligase family protein [Oscillospiraceae bacterium]|nr:O-antigen ligase family protein [Oscillospiraceae bacterium]